jgi:hypothetical protein
MTLVLIVAVLGAVSAGIMGHINGYAQGRRDLKDEIRLAEESAEEAWEFAAECERLAKETHKLNKDLQDHSSTILDQLLAEIGEAQNLPADWWKEGR